MQIMKEGCWAFDPAFCDEGITKIEELKDEFYRKLGDDQLFDCLDDAIRRIKEMKETHGNEKSGGLVE